MSARVSPPALLGRIEHVGGSPDAHRDCFGGDLASELRGEVHPPDRESVQRRLAPLVASLPPGTAVPVLREWLLALLTTEPSGAAPAAQEDRLLEAREAAARLGMSVQWLYRNAERFAFTRRIGSRTLRFSSVGIDRWLSRRNAR